jgi:hypothetical protein
MGPVAGFFPGLALASSQASLRLMAHASTSPAYPAADDLMLRGVRIPTWFLLGLILVVTCAVYAPALGGQILWDDNVHIPKPELRGVDGLARIWCDVTSTQQYYPLLFSSFWLQYQLWGEHLLGYHIVNLLRCYDGCAFRAPCWPPRSLPCIR